MATKKLEAPVAVPSSVITDDMFATDALVEHEVTLGDGSKRTFYFKQLTAIEWKQHIEAENSKDPKVRKESAVRLIAKCVAEPDGRRAMTPQQAARLKPQVSGAFFLAIMEINGFFKRPAEVDIPADEDTEIVDYDDDIEVIDEEEAGS